jgi:dienelactone hydrolase
MPIPINAPSTRSHGDHVTPRTSLKALLAVLLISVCAAVIPAMANADTLPDPMLDGPHPVTTMSINPSNPGVPGDAQEAKLGLVNLQEPNGSGGAPGTGTPEAAANSVNLQVRGSLYYPTDTTKPAPLIFLVHGNHGSCHVSGPSGFGAECNTFNRNDTGYAYLAHNLASWGYVVFSLDQDQLIFYQDGSYGKGMHQRRLLMAAALDGLYQANQPGGLPVDANDNVGTQLVGKIDFNRIGLMGHSRGGDATTSFLNYNATRPAPGRRYTIRASLALAPVDYERHAPSGIVYGMEAGVCDGDVSNLQGTRMYSRSLHIDPNDPFPRVQMLLHGANHDAFNSEWDADGEDATTADPACGPSLTTNPTSIRLSRGAYGWSSVNGSVSNFFSPSPVLMGDQEKAGLATMAEFFRRYVGGETPFDPYMTGEPMYEGKTLLPPSACPTSQTGTNMRCRDRLSTSYFDAPADREDVIDPDPDNPLTVSELGTDLKGSGFADPYANSPGTATQTPTAQGFDWCNPEPNQFTPSQLGITPTLPTAVKPCPLPAANALGGQSNGARENAPVNGSYQPQLTLAWDNPVTANGKPAELDTRIPAANGDVTRFKTLSLSTSVNFFDPRNPTRANGGLTDPEAASQNFTATLTDAAGHTGAVDVGDLKYGLGLQQSVANTTARMHVILRDNRIPLADFAAQGVDLKSLRKITFQFGGDGMPQSGSIQLADVRFQESVNGPSVYADTDTATGPPTDPTLVAAHNATATNILADTPRAPASSKLPPVVWLDGGAKAATTTGKCADTLAPTAKIGKVKLAKRKLRLSGTAKDTGCGAKVASVHVTIAKKVGAKCAYVTASGSLGKKVKCAAGVSLVAKHTAKWSLALPHKLAKGTYTVTVSAIDAAGNVQATKKGRTVTVR